MADNDKQLRNRVFMDNFLSYLKEQSDVAFLLFDQ